MLYWLRDGLTPLLKYLSIHMDGAGLVVFGLVSLFFQSSRRMNARVEAAAPGPRLLRELALALAPPTKNKSAKTKKRKKRKKNRLTTFLEKARRTLAWLLQKTDWLLYEKLKLLPNPDTGRRLNYLPMLFASWLVANSVRLIFNSTALNAFSIYRNASPEQRDYLQMRPEALWTYFFLMLALLLMLLLPFFLVRKNREFYFDLTALHILLGFGIMKLIACWRIGCCFGIPWPGGVYNDRLGAEVFPVQLLEFALCALGAVLCGLYMLFGKTYRPGRGCSACALALTATRFGSEYLRYHGESYRMEEAGGFLGFTMSQIVCVAGAIAALVWLLVLPLEKKLMDRLWLLAARRLRRLAMKQAFFAKLLTVSPEEGP
ncbi:MAG: hypothetical protein FWH26_08895 [Oscillospiraceae bacterium]|nr:hypothetical protein [Oscillospiraceae bacterium]